MTAFGSQASVPFLDVCQNVLTFVAGMTKRENATSGWRPWLYFCSMDSRDARESINIASCERIPHDRHDRSSSHDRSSTQGGLDQASSPMWLVSKNIFQERKYT